MSGRLQLSEMRCLASLPYVPCFLEWVAGDGIKCNLQKRKRKKFNTHQHPFAREEHRRLGWLGIGIRAVLATVPANFLLFRTVVLRLTALRTTTLRCCRCICCCGCHHSRIDARETSVETYTAGQNLAVELGRKGDCGKDLGKKQSTGECVCVGDRGTEL